jgi:pseudaminic acid cytidylyltransferase
MKNLAIIPARGGSKRIPQKNIKLFHSKPILSYSIEVLKKSLLFNEIMVSTDDQIISDISIKYGASVPFLRSIDSSSDFATTGSVINEVINEYQKRGITFDNICCIYPTAALTKVQRLKDGYKLLNQNSYTTVFPIVKYGYPIWRGLIHDDKYNNIKMIWPENLNKRSQDLESTYHDAGQWYWINCEKFTGNLFSENSGAIILEENEVQDIDTPSDWELAELKYILNAEK